MCLLKLIRMSRSVLKRKQKYALAHFWATLYMLLFADNECTVFLGRKYYFDEDKSHGV